MHSDRVDVQLRSHTISESETKEKVAVARVSIFSNITLTILKLCAGLLSGSISILSEAIHSGMDLIASVIAYLSVKRSGEPPDTQHAYGHGKFEDISGLIEAVLIFIAGLVIIYEAVQKIFHPHEFSSSHLLIGILVMGISAVVNFFVSRQLMKVAKATHSIALEGDAWHLRTDIYTSLGVMGGLIVVYLTGMSFFDPLIAIFVALIIIKASIGLIKRSYHDLTDYSLSEEDRNSIEEVVLQYKGEFINMHDLKTRRAGPEVFIEFHMVVDGFMSVHDAHALIDTIEDALLHRFQRASVTVHLESCKRDCNTCTAQCHHNLYLSSPGVVKTPR
ncbi:MAG: cation diffusion facilitator family transporter [Methanomicrobiales archaeon]|jgi:cation diffusion facilitator family transporter|nr:cation diffusion facilitator family transporter [Methanomicrobiales archaeon]